MLRRRRRPLLRGAMIGGAGYMAGRAGQRNAESQQMSDVGPQQQAPPPPPPAPAAPDDVVARLTELASLKQSGALNDQEFEAAKAKLLGT